MTFRNTEEVIELRVNEVAQLFHNLDPFPFRERDLNPKMEVRNHFWMPGTSPEQGASIMGVHKPVGSQSAPKRTLTAVIFDVDGVLLASPHERAWREALHGFADSDRFTTSGRASAACDWHDLSHAAAVPEVSRVRDWFFRDHSCDADGLRTSF